MLRADDAAAGAIEQPVLGGQHDDRDRSKNLVVLDQRAGLITVQPRHHDIDEYDVGLMISDLGQRIETIDRRKDLATLLGEQRLRRATDALAVIDDQDFESL